MVVLVLEASTSSAKAMVLDTQRKEQKHLSRPYKPGTEKNPRAIFEQLMKVGSSLVSCQTVSMIALAGIWHSLLLCNREMEPVSPLWTWSDTDSYKLCIDLRKDSEYTKEYYQTTGCMVHSIFPFFKIKYFKNEGMIQKGHKIADQGSYIFYKLTGNWFASRSMASGSGFLDIRKKSYSSRVGKELGIMTEDQLPPLVDLGKTAPLCREAASLLGLKQGIPVLASLPDGGLNQVGSDAVQKGIMTLSMGTSAAMRLTSDKPYLPERMSTWSYIAPGGEYLNGAAISGCCNCVDWAKGQFFSENISYSDIEKQMDPRRQVPVFLPFLYGERCPGWNDEKKASYHGLKAHHSSVDKFQAVLEGVVFNLYQCFLDIQKSGVPIKKIKISGGVLNSNPWKQICCDVFSLPLTEDSVSQSSLMGGIKVALMCLGESYKTSHDETILMPDLRKRELYQQKFGEYLNWYDKSH
ncbi:MAG: FGGY family carbohydrate kinase [Spirochaetales bacterium]|nr:FGGY family carbohydrate kinase [Spirochaetales bacterium]